MTVKLPACCGTPGEPPRITQARIDFDGAMNTVLEIMTNTYDIFESSVGKT